MKTPDKYTSIQEGLKSGFQEIKLLSIFVSTFALVTILSSKDCQTSENLQQKTQTKVSKVIQPKN